VLRSESELAILQEDCWRQIWRILEIILRSTREATAFASRPRRQGTLCLRRTPKPSGHGQNFWSILGLKPGCKAATFILRKTSGGGFRNGKRFGRRGRRGKRRS